MNENNNFSYVNESIPIIITFHISYYIQHLKLYLKYEHGQGQELIFYHYNSFEYGKHFIFFVTKDIHFNSKQKVGFFVLIVAKYTIIIHEEWSTIIIDL